MSEPPTKTLREQAKDKGLEYLQKGGEPERIQDIKRQVMEQINASETTVYYGLKDAVTEFEKAVTKPREPEIKVIEEPIETPITEIQAEPPPTPTEPIKEPPKEVEEKTTEQKIDISRKGFWITINSLCGQKTFGERYGLDEEEVTTLCDIWYPVLEKHWEQWILEYGIEVFALVTTGGIIAPRIKMLIEDYNERRKKK